MLLINGTKSLRWYLEKNFKEQVGFFHSGRQASYCQYVASTLQGFGLQDLKNSRHFYEKRY